MPKLKHIAKYGLFTLLWMSLIWYLSAQPNLVIGLPGIWELFARKLAHIAIYTILALLLMKLFSHAWVGRRPSRVELVLQVSLVIILAVLFAISDEWHQSFIAGRQGSGIDIIIDSIGVLFGIVWGWRLQDTRLRHSWKILLTR
ncbi:MAG: VanZ family protein [Candidatus Komeilibacteria bacterium]